MTEAERYQLQLYFAIKHIDALLPYARAKRGESGDAAGVVKNVEDWLRLPIVLCTNIEVGDMIRARKRGET